ncbi:hypothetical protein INP17_13465, partial [Staphylococcus aureus]|nr:hypothetical protein [Staphylococcus aureus]
GKQIAQEFDLTDNDEIFIIFEDYKEAKRVIDKAFKIFVKSQNREGENNDKG